MNILLTLAAAYLLSGIAAILLLDVVTGRVRRRISSAAAQTQLLVGESPKLAFVITLLALWLLWPVAIYAAVRK